jgi:hypothetical protein
LRQPRVEAPDVAGQQRGFELLARPEAVALQRILDTV